MCAYSGWGVENQLTEAFHLCNQSTAMVLKSDLYHVPVSRYIGWQQAQFKQIQINLYSVTFQEI